MDETHIMQRRHRSCAEAERSRGAACRAPDGPGAGGVSSLRLAWIDVHTIVNALISEHRTGCQWRLLPADVPPMRSIRSSFDTWGRDGTFVTINDTLRQLARQALDRDPAPSISVLDS